MVFNATFNNISLYRGGQFSNYQKLLEVAMYAKLIDDPL